MMTADKGTSAAVELRAAFKTAIKAHFLQLHTHLVLMEANLMAKVSSSTRGSSLNVAFDKLSDTSKVSFYVVDSYFSHYNVAL